MLEYGMLIVYHPAEGAAQPPQNDAFPILLTGDLPCCLGYVSPLSAHHAQVQNVFAVIHVTIGIGGQLRGKASLFPYERDGKELKPWVRFDRFVVEMNDFKLDGMARTFKKRSNGVSIRPYFSVVQQGQSVTWPQEWAKALQRDGGSGCSISGPANTEQVDINRFAEFMQLKGDSGAIAKQDIVS